MPSTTSSTSGDRPSFRAPSLLDKATFFSNVPTRKTSSESKRESIKPNEESLGEGEADAFSIVVEKEPNVSCWAKTHNTCELVGQVVHRHPVSTILPPVLVLCVLAALGVYGTLAGAENYSQSLKDVAASAALDTAIGFKLTIEKTFAPLITLNSFIQRTPNYTELMPEFPLISEDLLSHLDNGTITSLQFSPFGYIMAEYPHAFYPASAVGINIFNESALRAGAIDTLQRGILVLSGPLPLVFNTVLAGIARLPVFVPNVSDTETFGNNVTTPYNLTIDQVYNYTTRTKFWGFVTAIISLEALTSGTDSRITGLLQKGYRYCLTRPDTTPTNPPFVIAQSTPPPGGDPVSVDFAVTNNVWTLIIAPENGWQASWKWPVVAAVIVMSFVIALMVFVMIVSVKHQQWLLQEMAVTNQQLALTTHSLEGEKALLAHEKARMDVMLVRQHNLIQCFSSAMADKGLSVGTDQSSAGSATVERIEVIRRQLNSENVKNLAETEQIQTMEVLGEGTYGKVYKGLWRGTEVAVKTMMLPANMSGQEKREKMAVMEAAISSSLAHPNVVATYTYSIKPVRDSTQCVDVEQLDAGIILMAGSTGIDPKSSGPTSGTHTEGESVHSFEVRLVLEYCDKGCLREALDAGAFFGHVSLNYRAILDTALDIAKAMCHLHSMNVLHGDLKARNVMLKSSGDSRGWVAKVADFGLSVKMDHLETHMSNVFMGTMTHMAPEVMLEGRVSKAADVYAYGITLWELFTGGQALKGVPRALMGHLITKEHKRPAFNLATPTAFKELAERCWAPRHEDRPTFDEIMSILLDLRSAEIGRTPTVKIEAPKPRASRDEALIKPTTTNGDSFKAGASGVSKAKPWTANQIGSGSSRFRPAMALQPVLENGESTDLHAVREASRSAEGAEGEAKKDSLAAMPPQLTLSQE